MRPASCSKKGLTTMDAFPLCGLWKEGQVSRLRKRLEAGTPGPIKALSQAPSWLPA
jgi:hypothetical protein